MLRDAGFRATYGRVALLEALEQAQKPKPQGMLNLPGAKPTPVQRISGNV